MEITLDSVFRQLVGSIIRFASNFYHSKRITLNDASDDVIPHIFLHWASAAVTSKASREREDEKEEVKQCEWFRSYIRKPNGAAAFPQQQHHHRKKEKLQQINCASLIPFVSFLQIASMSNRFRHKFHTTKHSHVRIRALPLQCTNIIGSAKLCVATVPQTTNGRNGWKKRRTKTTKENCRRFRFWIDCLCFCAYLSSK